MLPYAKFHFVGERHFAESGDAARGVAQSIQIIEILRLRVTLSAAKLALEFTAGVFG